LSMQKDALSFKWGRYKKWLLEESKIIYLLRKILM
jgi:hypothetical protein